MRQRKDVASLTVNTEQKENEVRSTLCASKRLLLRCSHHARAQDLPIVWKQILTTPKLFHV